MNDKKITIYMKKVTALALCLISILGIWSCNKERISLPEDENSKVHQVDFVAHMEESIDATRTGVTLKMIHNWINTKAENIHLYEKDNLDDSIIEGEDVTITTEDPYEIAKFSAGFYNSIIVNPTKGMVTQSFTYSGVIAQRNADKKFFIPEVQYPQEESWIDPDADFIIGQSSEQPATLSKQTIYFEFYRPVSISRLAITNLEGTYLKSVTITSDDNLTGEAGYFDIDFDKEEVGFSGGTKSITMIFPEGTKVSSTTYANFVSTPGKKHITKVEVVTDKYVYTKNTDGNLTFKKATFKNIAMDLTLDENCTRIEINPQPLVFKRGGEEVLTDSYDLASQNPYESPVLEGWADGANVSYATSNDKVATVDASTGEVTPVAVGKVDITATATATQGYDKTTKSFSLTVTDSSVPVDQVLEFSQTSFNHTYGETFTEPSLTGAHTDVTYTTDANTVATVDSLTGKVTFIGVAGTVKVKATAAEGKVGEVQYNKGEAEYSIVVTVPGSDTTYYKASAIEAGYEYIIVSNGHAVKNVNGELKDSLVTDSNNTLSLKDASAILWTAAKPTTTLTAGTYTLTNEGKSIYRISNKSTQNLGIGAIPAELTKYYLWDYKENHITHISSDDYYWFYYDSSDGWKIKYDDTISSDNPTVLYEARQPQVISFNSSAAKYDIGTSAYTTNLPTLSGNKGTVKYYAESGKTGVATVNESTGAVTIVGKGKVKIYAQAASTTQYQASDAVYYELEVINSTATTTTYYKVTEAEVGKSYIIVSEGYALKNNSGSIAAEAVTVESDQIELEDASDLLWTASAVQTEDEDYPGLNYSNDGYYLFRNSSTLSLEKSITDEHNNFNYTSSSSKYYLKCGSYYVYYSSEWKAGTSSTSAKKVALYCSEKPASYTYTKVATATTTLAEGTYLIVNPNGAKALDSSNTGTSNTVSVSPSSGVITGNYSANEFEIKKTNDGYTIKSITGNKYLYYNSNTSSTRMGYQSDKAYFGIETGSIDNSLFYLSNGTSSEDKVYLYYSSSSYFKFGTSGDPTDEDAGVVLYKKETPK